MEEVETIIINISNNHNSRYERAAKRIDSSRRTWHLKVNILCGWFDR